MIFVSATAATLRASADVRARQERNSEGAGDNAPYDLRMLFKEAGHKARYHPPLPNR